MVAISEGRETLSLSSSDQWCGTEEKRVIGAAGRAGGEARGLTLTTSKVEAAALGGAHPEVGGARVKDDFEGLGWGTNADLAIVLALCGAEEK